MENNTGFEKISNEFLGYLMYFLNVKELFDMIKLNKHVRQSILQNNIIIPNFIQIKKLNESNSDNIEEYLAEESNKLLKVERGLQKNENFSKQHRRDIFNFLFSGLNKSDNIAYYNSGNSESYYFYLKYFLISPFCNVKTYSVYFISNNWEKITLFDIAEVIDNTYSIENFNLTIEKQIDLEYFPEFLESLTNNKTIKENLKNLSNIKFNFNNTVSMKNQYQNKN